MSEQLKVIIEDGTGRGGKGTIANDIEATYSGVARDETGIDYRAVTFVAVKDSVIEAGMPDEVAIQKVEGIGLNELIEIAASRPAIVEEYGEKALYDGDVKELVSVVSQSDTVRQAVKGGFKKRVEAVVAAGESQFLVVEGRNLSPIIQKVEGAKLIMRMFVSCVPIEAAIRECARLGKDPSNPEALLKELKLIKGRNARDANRPVDAVKPDKDVIDYWLDGAPYDEVKRLYMHHDLENDFIGTYQKVVEEGHHYLTAQRTGRGWLSAATGLQIHFDTSIYRMYEDPKGAMLKAARQMFEEAVEA